MSKCTLNYFSLIFYLMPIKNQGRYNSLPISQAAKQSYISLVSRSALYQNILY